MSMKAVIMAGGKGTRLRPLTQHLPKPMVPLLDRPCMEYILDLLRRHGITEIAVTVQYLPQVIRQHFGDGSEHGVQLHYFEELAPLGTAGSVKNCQEFLDETFLVISGDALTDFDLTRAIAFHKVKEALATLVLTRVEVPLEYGVVMTEESGRVSRFLEKPSWSEVFSDTVNTGIYVMEPEVLELFDAGAEYDFSKDLFPLMMERGLPLCGYVADGYWSDIGSLSQYRQTQFDMLSGIVDVEIRGEEIMPGIHVGEGAVIQEGVQVTAPCFIGAGTELRSGARVGPCAVLGRYNRIEQGAEVERAVLWNRNYVGPYAYLSGATLCHRVLLESGASVLEEAVIGDKSVIGERAVIRQGLKIGPGKHIGAHTVLHDSLLAGASVRKGLFGTHGIAGIANVEMTPEVIGKIAAAYAAALPFGAQVTLSADEDAFSTILKGAAGASLLAGGVNVRDLGVLLAPLARYGTRRSAVQGGLHIRRDDADGERRTVVQVLDGSGLPVDKGMERKIESAWAQEEFARPGLRALGRLEAVHGTADDYVADLLAPLDLRALQRRRFKIVLHGRSAEGLTVMNRVLDRLGCLTITVFNGEVALEAIVCANKADLGISIDASGRHCTLYTERGELLTPEEVFVLKTVLALEAGLAVPFPVTAPTAVAELALAAGGEAVRTKARERDLLEVSIRQGALPVHGDAFRTLALLLQHLQDENLTLQLLAEQLPGMHRSTYSVVCPVEAKGRVMRRLMEEMKGRHLELLDGIKVLTEEGFALILPDAEKALFNIVVESRTQSGADELADLYTRKIVTYQQT